MNEKPKFSEEDGVIKADFSRPAEEAIPWKWKFEEMRAGLKEIRKSHPDLDAEAEKYAQSKDIAELTTKDIEAMVIFANEETWHANPALYAALLAEWDKRIK